LGKISEAFVELVTRDNLDAGLNRARDKMSRWVTRQQREIGRGMDLKFSGRGLAALAGGLTGGLAIGGTVAFLASATDKAADLAETMSKVEQVFGGNSGEVTNFAQSMANAFGLVKKETLDAAANFGLIAQGMGMGRSESAAFSNQFVRLAADASSFYNVPVADALERIRAGLVGESEPLRKFGVNLTAANVEAKALEMGLAGSKAELSDYDKVVARAALITDGLKAASGDLARTFDSLSNAKRKLSGDMENLHTELGAALIDPMGDAIKLVYEFGDALAGVGGQSGGITAIGNAIGGIVNQLRFVTSTGAGNFLDEGFYTLTSMIDPTGFSAGRLHDIQAQKAEEIARLDKANRDAQKAAIKETQGDLWKPGQGGADNPAGAAVREAKKANDALAKSMRDVLKDGTSSQSAFAGKQGLAAGMLLTGMMDPAAYSRFVGGESGIDKEIARREKAILADEKKMSGRGVSMYGDLYSAHQASTKAALEGDTQREQLDTAKKQLDELKGIRESLVKGDPSAFGRFEAILTGPE
jgi:hypothetical protein